MTRCFGALLVRNQHYLLCCAAVKLKKKKKKKSLCGYTLSLNIITQPLFKQNKNRKCLVLFLQGLAEVELPLWCWLQPLACRDVFL